MIGYNSTSLRHTLPPCTLQSSNSCSPISFDHAKQQRIVIIGAGPTGLGAAHRLYNMGILNSSTQVVVLERESQPGGLASSIRNRNGLYPVQANIHAMCKEDRQVCLNGLKEVARSSKRGKPANFDE